MQPPKRRKYTYKVQYRNSESEEWSTKSFPLNTYKIADRAPIPQAAYSHNSGFLPKAVYIRDILEAVNDDGTPIVRVIREYPPYRNLQIKQESGTVFAKCKIEGCGAKILPSQSDNHLRTKHDIRLRTLGKQPKPPIEYFDLVTEHGHNLTFDYP